MSSCEMSHTEPRNVTYPVKMPVTVNWILVTCTLILCLSLLLLFDPICKLNSSTIILLIDIHCISIHKSYYNHALKSNQMFIGLKTSDVSTTSCKEAECLDGDPRRFYSSRIS